MTSSVDGLVTGLDTTSLINQMMQVEAQTQTALRNRVTSEQSSLTALQSVNSKFVTLQTAAAALSAPSSWSAFKATSSSDAVTANVTGAATSGSFSFDVTQVAAAASYVSSSSLSGLTAVAATGDVTITRADGTSSVVHVTDTSLGGIVAAINASDAGVRAAAVQVAPGQFRLQLTSATTGSTSSFTVAGLDPSITLQQLVVGADAQLTVGAGGPAAYTVTSSSNTFTGVLPGVTFTVTKPATGVSIDVTPDGDALADKLKSVVDAANAALDEISKQTAYNASTKTGGPLLGDSTVRSLQQRLLDTVSEAVGASSAGSVGVELDRSGHVTFDRTKFLAAYNADPAKVRDVVARSSTWTGATTTTGTVRFVAAGDRTAEGSYPVVVTQAATQARATVDLAGGIAAGDTVTLSDGTHTVTYTADGTEDAAALAAKLSALASGAGIDVSAAASGTMATLTANRYGSGPSFTVQATGSPVATATTAGVDAAGTIGGVAAVGRGQVLSVSTTGKPVSGLAVEVTLTAADVAGLTAGQAGTISYIGGLAGRLSALATEASDFSDGRLTTAITSEQAAIKDLGDQVDAWDVRLIQRRTMLQQQFADLEVAMGKLRDQSNWLSGQLASLPQGQG